MPSVPTRSDVAPYTIPTAQERTERRGNVALKCDPCRKAKKFCAYKAPTDTCERCTERQLPCGPKELADRRITAPGAAAARCAAQAASTAPRLPAQAQAVSLPSVSTLLPPLLPRQELPPSPPRQALPPPPPRIAMLAPLAALTQELEARKEQLGAHAAQLGARLAAREVGLTEAHTQLGNIDAELRNVNGQLESIAAFSDGPVFAYNQAA